MHYAGEICQIMCFEANKEASHSGCEKDAYPGAVKAKTNQEFAFPLCNTMKFERLRGICISIATFAAYNIKSGLNLS